MCTEGGHEHGPRHPLRPVRAAGQQEQVQDARDGVEQRSGDEKAGFHGRLEAPISVWQVTKKPTMVGVYAVAGSGGTLTSGRCVLTYSISNNPKRS